MRDLLLRLRAARTRHAGKNANEDYIYSGWPRAATLWGKSRRTCILPKQNASGIFAAFLESVFLALRKDGGEDVDGKICRQILAGGGALAPPESCLGNAY
jgi:hypothetical protein